LKKPSARKEKTNTLQHLRHDAPFPAIWDVGWEVVGQERKRTKDRCVKTRRGVSGGKEQYVGGGGPVVRLSRKWLWVRGKGGGCEKGGLLRVQVQI